MNITDEYRKVAPQGTGQIIKKYPVSYYPQLISEDYSRGYIIRYFLRLKANKYSTIIEVNEAEYKKFTSNNIINGYSFFEGISLRWKITGKRNDVIMGNTKTLESKELFLPGISKTVGNRLQFWKE